MNPIYSELKLMTQINIENPMLLNSKLLSSKKLEINSKIMHLVLPSTNNLKKVDFFPKRLLGQSLKHMVKCFKEVLTLNPVFFSLVNIETLDPEYIHRFNNNKSISEEEIKLYTENYEKSVDLICHLLSDKVDCLDFGKKFWSLSDLN